MMAKAMKGIEARTAKVVAGQVEAYVLFKRGLGVEMATAAVTLAQLVRFAEAASHDGPIDRDLAVAWATSGTNHTRRYEASRYELARRVADFSRAMDPTLPSLPPGILGRERERITPYIFTDEEVSTLMSCASRLYFSHDPLRPLSVSTSIGLMRACGLRPSEAIALEDDDLDLDAGTIAVRDSKFGRTRVLPVHPSVVSALADYREARDSARADRTCTRLIVGDGGKEMKIWTLDRVFESLRMCLLDRGQMWERRPPRLYDLRHSMAVRTLLRWHGEGRDVNSLLPVLSRYMGHESISETYWYLTGTPELMEVASGAFESHFAGLSPSDGAPQ